MGIGITYISVNADPSTITETVKNPVNTTGGFPKSTKELKNGDLESFYTERDTAPKNANFTVSYSPQKQPDNPTTVYCEISSDNRNWDCNITKSGFLKAEIRQSPSDQYKIVVITQP